MTVTAPPARQLVTTAMLAMLRLPVASRGLGILVGDNQAPRWPQGRLQPDPGLDFPYGVLFDLDGGGRDGDMVDGYTGDAQFAYQLSIVGRRRDQAQLESDRACAVLVGRTDGQYTSTLADPAGLTIIRRTLDPPAGVLKQGDGIQSVWLVPLRFRLDVTAG